METTTTAAAPLTIRYANGGTTRLDEKGRGVSPSPSDKGAGVTLLGFSITSTPDVADYPASYRAPNYYHADELPELAELTGFYAQFVGPGGAMFGWAVPIESVTR